MKKIKKVAGQLLKRCFLSDPNFPKIRVGSKWLFPCKEVDRYIDIWAIEKRAYVDEKLQKR